MGHYDTIIKAGTYCPACRGMPLEDCYHTVEQLRRGLSPFHEPPKPIIDCTGVTITPREDGGPTLREFIETVALYRTTLKLYEAARIIKETNQEAIIYSQALRRIEHKIESILAHFKIDGEEG